MKENIMGTKPVAPLLLGMAFPIMISMLVQALYNIVDSIFVARLSDAALAAVSFAYPVQMLTIAVAVGTSVGVNALLSRRLGEGNREAADTVAHNGMLLMFFSWLAFAVFGLFCSELFFSFFTTNPAIAADGAAYLRVCLVFSLGMFFQICLERLIQVTGRTVFQMLSQMSGAIVNIAETATVTVTEGGNFNALEGSTVNNKGSFLDFQSGRAEVSNYTDLAAAASSALVEEIVLTADIEATGVVGAVTASIDLNGFDLDMGTYTLNVYAAGTDGLVVPAGSTLTLGGVVKVAEDGLSTVAGSNIVYEGTGYFAHTGSTTPTDIEAAEFTPEFASLTNVTIPVGENNSRTYAIRHYETNNFDDYQFGVGYADLKYEDRIYTDEDIRFYFASFDEGYEITEGSSWVRTDDTVSIEDARDYVQMIRLQMNIAPIATDADDKRMPDVCTALITITVDPSDSKAYFINEVLSSKIDVSEVTVLEDDEGYYYLLPFTGMIWRGGESVIMPSDYTDFTLTVNGVEAQFVEGKVRVPVDSVVNPSDVEIVFDADGNGNNYAETTYTITFSDLKATADLDIHVTTDDEYAEMETLYGDWSIQANQMYESGLTITQGEAAEGAVVMDADGTLTYISEFREFPNQPYGWFLPITITLPESISWNDVTVFKTNNHTTSTGEKDQMADLAVYKGKDIQNYVLICQIGYLSDEGISIHIEVGSNYVFDYQIDISGLEFQSYAGYVDNGREAGDIAEEDLGGIEKDDVVGETMYFISNPVNYVYPEGAEVYYGVWEGDLTGKTLAVDDAVFTEAFNTTSVDEIWYFSFIDVPLQTQSPDYNALPGTYTLAAYYVDEDDNVVVLDDATADIDGVEAVESGFDVVASVAESNIKENGGTINPGIQNQVADFTMWAVYAQNGYSDCTVNGYVFFGQETIPTNVKEYSESDDIVHTEGLNSADGIRTWYFSFDPDNESWIEKEIQKGTYYLQIVATPIDGEGEAELIASIPCEVKSIDSAVSFEEPNQTNLDKVDITAADLQTTVTFPTTVKIDGESGNRAAAVTITAQLFYVKGFTGFNESDPSEQNGYFLAFNVNAADFDWSEYPDLVVKLGDKTFTAEQVKSGEWDGTVIYFLGTEVPTDDKKTYTLQVDYDGEKEFYENVTYTITVDFTAVQYKVVLKDQFNDDLTYDDVKDGDNFTLTYGAGPGFMYWIDENGKNRYGGSAFNISAAMDTAPKDGVITLTAVYAGTSEHSIQYWIGAAPEYVYPAGYTYNGWYDIDGTTVYAVYSADEYTAGTPMMHDFARYLGALYYASEGDIVSIYVDGELYTWDADGPQIGSNWYNADGDTLVSVIAALFQSADGYAKNGITMELTNQAGDRVAMNYYLAVESDGTGSGDDGYALPRQLSDYYLDVVLNDDNTVTVSLKVDADKIDGYVNALSAVQFTVFDWSTYKYVTFDEHLGVVFIAEPSDDGTVASITIEYSADYQITASGLVTLTVPMDTVDLRTFDVGTTTQDESVIKTE